MLLTTCGALDNIIDGEQSRKGDDLRPLDPSGWEVGVDFYMEISLDSLARDENVNSFMEGVLRGKGRKVSPRFLGSDGTRDSRRMNDR